MKYGVRLIEDADWMFEDDWYLLELPDQVVLVMRRSCFGPAVVAEAMAAVAAAGVAAAMMPVQRRACEKVGAA